MKRGVRFHSDAFEQYQNWSTTDFKVFQRISALIQEICRDPFKGTGKPEPLKGNLSGCWSRRIDKQHRLVYKVDNDTVFILSCHGHY